MSTIPDVMRSVTEVLATAEELLEDGDSDRHVANMLTSFLKTLLVDLDETLMAQGHLRQTNHQGNVIGKNGEDLYLTHRPSQRKHMDCTAKKCLAGQSSECPHAGSNVKVTSTKTPVVNKYPGQCVRCGTPLVAGEGYVLPAADKNAKKKWHTFCLNHWTKEVT